MFVVKVGEYYVKQYNNWDGLIILSNEIMRGFDIKEAEVLAKKLNGEVRCLQDPLGMSEEVVNE
jgi:hypothetical protein